MNDGNEMMDALMGGKKTAPGGKGGEDWEAMYKELKSEYDAKRPMLGRVGELSEKDRRISELEKEVERMKAEMASATSAATVMDVLTPEERELPEEYIGAAAKIASRAADTALRGVSDEMARMRMEREKEQAAGREAERSRFLNRVNARFPKFLPSISEGGANFKAWSEFLAMNAGSVKSALENMDFDVLEYHITRFYKEVLEVNPPEAGFGASAAPDPRSQGSGAPATNEYGKKNYTAEEYDALSKECDDLRRRGKFEKYRDLRDELDSAISEGRVRD